MLMKKGEYTFNEIIEQPVVWKKVIERLKTQKEEFSNWFKEENFEEIILIGCGASYNLALSAAWVMELLLKIKTRSIPGSEILFNSGLYLNKTKKTLIISISRSGETTENIWAIESLKKTSENIKILSICAYPQTSLNNIVDKSIIIEEAQEKSIVMTKAFTSFLLTLLLLTSFFSNDLNFQEELEKIPNLLNMKKYQKEIQQISSEKYHHFAFLGNGPFYGIACESMLLLREMVLIFSESFPALEYRHGPLCIVGPQSLITFFVSDTLKDLESSLTKDILNLKGQALIICEEANKLLKNCCTYIFELYSGISEKSRGLLMIPLIQLMAFHTALNRGYNPDKPKNLNMVVTLQKD